MKQRFFTALMMSAAVSAALASADKCYSRLDGDTLKIGNDRIERRFLWNGGNLITAGLTDKMSGKVLHTTAKNPDFTVNRASASDGRIESSVIAADGIRPEYLAVEVSYRLGALDVRRVYRVYDGVPAIACDTYLRGRLDGVVVTDDTGAADRKNIEHTDDMKSRPVTAVIDRMQLDGQHWHGKAVEFWDITDWNNNLVAERDFISYRRTNYRGNLLFVSDGVADGGFLFLKEAPCSSVQLAYRNADFICDFGDFMVTGLGVTDADITPDKWTRIYGAVLCSYGSGELSALQSLRAYQKQCRILDPDRDEMVMMNTWGDRSQDSKVNEAFCMAELEKASRLGVSLFQIDDGWQAGKSPNSAVAKGSFKDIWRNDGYWTPDSVKYPRGLTPVVERGRELGIEVGLWFNPSVQDDFADWEKDASTIVGLYRKYGIRMFKIDGLTITSKKGEENLRKLFDRVLADTGNQVMFNLDATASRRGGYHMFNEYGNIFLENRYTDWGNYYPYWTLRNVWMLSKYVPAERLQVEFLNNGRNAAKYGDDPFAPANYGFDYLFATTMAGQPLAWMEASNLDEKAFSIKPLVDAYRSFQHDFHNGVILPAGDEPSGRSWTGFQSIADDCSGYMIVYRENNPDSTHRLATWLPAGARVRFSPLAGKGRKFTARVDGDGSVMMSLPEPGSFAVYKYQILK
ncbi:MAG: alpha-galactosidase [Muribaculaceae bacterium]|nr:alpha-galactosidase [Muribaculaceae bacterium]